MLLRKSKGRCDTRAVTTVSNEEGKVFKAATSANNRKHKSSAAIDANKLKGLQSKPMKRGISAITDWTRPADICLQCNPTNLALISRHDLAVLQRPLKGFWTNKCSWYQVSLSFPSSSLIFMMHVNFTVKIMAMSCSFLHMINKSRDAYRESRMEVSHDRLTEGLRFHSGLCCDHCVSSELFMTDALIFLWCFFRLFDSGLYLNENLLLKSCENSTKPQHLALTLRERSHSAFVPKMLAEDELVRVVSGQAWSRWVRIKEA